LVDQFAASAYVWWALASVVAVAAVKLSPRVTPKESDTAVH
jgi:alpha-1,2-mannosyltransferase